MPRIKVALIGYGHLGKWHAQKVRDSALSELVAIVEKSPEARALAQKQYSNVAVVDDLEKVVDFFEAAIVATPTSFHFEVCDQLLDREKHIFCEKPMTVSSEESLQLLNKFGKTKNLIFQVGHSERCHEAWEKLTSDQLFKDVMSEKESVVTIRRVSPFKGRATDVDVVSDLMIHDLDLLYCLFDEQPLSVESFGHKMRTDKWDYVHSIFEFKSGLRAILEVGRNQAIEERLFSITNRLGSISVDLLNNKMSVSPSIGKSADGHIHSINYRKRDHLSIEQEKFYRSISNGDPVFVDIHAGAKIVNMIEKVLESLEAKKRILI